MSNNSNLDMSYLAAKEEIEDAEQENSSQYSLHDDKDSSDYNFMYDYSEPTETMGNSLKMIGSRKRKNRQQYSLPGYSMRKMSMQSQIDHHDNLRNFFGVICDTVRNFPKKEIAQIKYKISQIVCETEVRLASEEENVIEIE